MPHIQKVFLAPTADCHSLHQAEKSPGHLGIQNQVWAGVGLQGVGHGACLAHTGSPWHGLPVTFDQSAGLGAAPPVEVFVVVLTFFARRCLH